MDMFGGGETGLYLSLARCFESQGPPLVDARHDCRVRSASAAAACGEINSEET
jgi:hypothetical protein